MKISRGGWVLLCRNVLMIKIIPIPFLLILFYLLPVMLHAQDIAVLFEEARKLEAEFKENEALQKYIEIQKIQPQNKTALCRASELYSLVGKRQPTTEKQKSYFQSARNYAQLALKLDPTLPEANFAMALAMGRMAIVSSGEEKIKAVKEIKIYADKCLQSDPANFKAYHILGRWHYEVSDLSGFEKWLVKVMYGSLPPASLKDAISNYEKSKQLDPGLTINYLELAKCYHRKDDDKKAIEYLNQLLKLPNRMVDDPTVKAEANQLLKKWSD